jgi:replicative DNA helicase
LLLQAARTAAAADFPALIISLEMRKEELLRRLLSMHLRMPYSRLRDPREMNVSDRASFMTYAGELAELQL